MNRELKLLNILLPSTYVFLVMTLNILISVAYIEFSHLDYSRQQFGNVMIFLCALDILIAAKGFVIKRVYYRFNREKSVQKLVNHLIEYDYPEPSLFGDGNFEWYMLNVIDDERIDPAIRVDAAKLFATYDAIFPSDGESYLNSSQYIVYSTAIARYKMGFN